MVEEKTLIIINGQANAGEAKRKWEVIEKAVLHNLDGKVIVKIYEPPYDLRSFLNDFANLGYYRFIVGGGDGTINFASNILYKLQQRGIIKNLILGALALGSSNDFFKPISHQIQNTPVRIDMEQAKFEDIGIVNIQNKQGKIKEKIFMVNAGLGVTAQANYLFNNPNGIIAFLKPRAAQLAILATAILTILKHSNKRLTIRFNKEIIKVDLSNLSITLIPYVSGSFHYKKERSKRGTFDIFLCKDMRRVALLKTLITLSQGKFKTGLNRIVDRSKVVEVQSKNDIPMEIDGEVFLGHYFKFQLKANVIRFAI